MYLKHSMFTILHVRTDKLYKLLDAHQHFFEGFWRCFACIQLFLLFLGDVGICCCLFLFGLEALYTTHGVYEAHFTREKRMAFAADFKLDFFFGCSYGKRIAACAGYGRVWIPFRMDVGFHKKLIIAKDEAHVQSRVLVG